MSVNPEDLTWEATANDANSLAEMHKLLDDFYRVHHFVKVEFKAGKQRTSQQRKAIEVYCRSVAEALNDAGLDQRKVLAAMREGVEIPWRQESVKDTLWRRVQQAALEKQSTTELERAKEVSLVYDILNRWLSSTFGVSVPFPEKRLQEIEKQEAA